MKRREFVKLATGTVFVILEPLKMMNKSACAAMPRNEMPLPKGNPFPRTIESPEGPGGAEAAWRRLSQGSEGKTPTVKNFSAAWVRSLVERGTPKCYTAEDSANFQYIGMPVGGIGTGQVYLGGDGKLWWWDIFNNRASVWPNDQFNAYVNPYREDDAADEHQFAIAQGFALRVQSGGRTETRPLDKRGFWDIEFSGQYPIGTASYRDPGLPVSVRLEAFSPFVPLNAADSSLPATLMQYTVTNHGTHPATGEIAGWLQNAICIRSAQAMPGVHVNHAKKGPGSAWVEFAAEDMHPDSTQAVTQANPATIFEDWVGGTYDQWTVSGTAFGTRPAKKGEIFHSEAVQNESGQYMANSFLGGKDDAQGRLTSKPFAMARPYINVLLGGGNHPGTACINLLVDGKVARTATGRDSETLRWETWNVAELSGKQARIEIVDAESGGWGHVLVDTIDFADTPRAASGGAGDVKTQRDFGTMALAALGIHAVATAGLGAGTLPEAAFRAAPQPEAARDFAASVTAPHMGAVSQSFSLAPGQSATLTFALAWHFPNPLDLGLQTDMRREYVARFGSASEVVGYLQKNLARLTSQTHLWRETWYDSTLPFWFLDRTFLNTSILATSTSYRLYDGRFYGYEGMYSCPGTCTHVWGYVQALGHLFPELDKAILEHDHLHPGIGIRADGGVPARSEIGDNPAVDGQSDIILRSFLAHQYSPDNTFLQRNYPQIKRALEYLRATNDPDGTGTLVGSQHNTLDAEYFTRGAWLSLNYQAALRAMAEMAEEMGESAYADTLRQTADRGREYVETHLFNGEYFYQEHDPKYPNSTGTFSGCEYSQLVGENWSHQVGLGPIVDTTKAITALNTLWRYSYTTDVGPYTKIFGTGRPFVLPGEGGIIGCTWPRGDNSHNVAYLSECQSGYEYACSAAMLWNGLVDKALAHVRTVHDRYDGSKRNPWNEVEAGSHYSRAMASYGLFLAACGFEWHGPRGHLAFLPRLTPENFKAAFTTAEGWGTFAQKREGGCQRESIMVKQGHLRVRTLAFAVPDDSAVHVTVQFGGNAIAASSAVHDRRLTITLASDAHVAAGQSLEVVVAPASVKG